MTNPDQRGSAVEGTHAERDPQRFARVVWEARERHELGYREASFWFSSDDQAICDAYRRAVDEVFSKTEMHLSFRVAGSDPMHPGGVGKYIWEVESSRIKPEDITPFFEVVHQRAEELWRMMESRRGE